MVIAVKRFKLPLFYVKIYTTNEYFSLFLNYMK